jgi:hypothetical protein
MSAFAGPDSQADGDQGAVIRSAVEEKHDFGDEAIPSLWHQAQ